MDALAEVFQNTVTVDRRFVREDDDEEGWSSDSPPMPTCPPPAPPPELLAELLAESVHPVSAFVPSRNTFLTIGNRDTMLLFLVESIGAHDIGISVR